MINIPYPGGKRYAYPYLKRLAEDTNYLRAYEPYSTSFMLTANLMNDFGVESGFVNDRAGLFDLYPEYLDIKDHLVEVCLEHGIRKIIHTKQGYCYENPDGTRELALTRALNPDEKRFLQSEVAKIDEKFWPLLAMGGNFTFPSVSSHKKVYLSDFCYFQGQLDTAGQREYLEMVDEMERVNMGEYEFLDYYADKFDKYSLIIATPVLDNNAFNTYRGVEEQTYWHCRDFLERLAKTGSDFVFFFRNPKYAERMFREAGVAPEFMIETTNFRNRSRRDVMAYFKMNKEESELENDYYTLPRY